MSTNVRELLSQRAALLEEAESMIDYIDSPAKERKYNALIRQADELNAEIEKRERGGALDFYSAYGGRQGLSEAEKAIAHYIRSGDVSALADTRIAAQGDMPVLLNLPTVESRSSVDSTMNITTAGDGGNAVPTGFAGKIAARRSEIRISTKLGCQTVLGKGTTVNYPYESSGPELFVATSEQADNHGNNYDRDAPQLANKAFNLVKYTKKIEITEELLEDEDAKLLDWVAESTGRAYGMTLNSLLLTEVAANGTALKTFGSATAIAVDEPEEIVFNDDLAPYLDDGNTCAWVMRKSVHGEIILLDDANTRRYSNNALGNGLLGYPVMYSAYAGATQASAKSCFFGNWYYVGERLAPDLRMLRDPYTVDGMVVLKFAFRCKYGVLQPLAIGFGAHPSS